MAVIGNIDIGLSVNVKSLKRDLNTAAKMVSDFGSKMVSMLTSPLALFGVGLSAAGFVAFTKNALEAVDATDEFAQQIGTTAGQLNTLRYQAKLTGTETGAIDGALQKMTRTLGMAASGSGPAAKAFKSLGLDARQLATMDPGAAFQKIAAAIALIPNPAQQASAAIAIFGRGSIAIMNTLRAGPEQMKKLADEARRLGVAVTPEDVAKISLANDAMDRLGFATQGLGITLATNVAPAVTKAIEGFVKWATEGNRLSNFVTEGFARIRDAIIFARAVLENWEPIFDIIELKVAQFSVNTEAYFNAFLLNSNTIFEALRDNWGLVLKNMIDSTFSFFNTIGDHWGGFIEFFKDLWSGMSIEDASAKLANRLIAPFRAAVPAALRDAVGRFVGPELVDYTNLVNDAQRRLEGGMADSLNRMGYGLRDKGGPPGPGKPGGPGLAATAATMSPPKFAEMAIEGSKEAYAAIARHRGGGDSAMDKLAENSDQQTVLQRRMAEALEGMEDAEDDPYSMAG